MADEGKRLPVGDAVAQIDRGNDQRSDWVPLGPVWATRNGHLTVTLASEPLAWRDPKTKRRVLIRLRADINLARSGAESSGGERQPGEDEEIPF